MASTPTFSNDFAQLLKEELQQQNKSDAEIQSKISFIENDAEFKELRVIQEKEDTEYYANTAQELENDSKELHSIVSEQKKLGDAIENHAARVEHMETTYFKHADIPAPTPVPIPTQAPTPTTAPTPGSSPGGGSSGGGDSSSSGGYKEPE